MIQICGVCVAWVLWGEKRVGGVITVYVLAMVGHLKNVSTTFPQMPIRMTNAESTTVSPNISNTMLAVRCFLFNWFVLEYSIVN